MSVIQVSNLSFSYPGSYTPVFEGLDFTFDSRWRLGLVGRNGRGKTTLLKLLSGALQGSGRMVSNLQFDYFPFPVDESLPALACMKQAVAPFEQWEREMDELIRQGSEQALLRWGELQQQYALSDGYIIEDLLKAEADKMRVDPGELNRPLNSFSPGQRTRLLLAAMFLRKNRFLLIDEPTNHLDAPGRQAAANYLRGKQGFILVSHDRWFLDQTVDHIAALEKTALRIEQGNYSSYRENKALRDAFEIEQNQKLKTEINRLQQTAMEKAAWSNAVENTKIGNGPTDRGRIGHLAAKAMKRSLTIQTRIDRKIEEKQGLLKDLEYASALSLHPLTHPAKVLWRLHQASAGYDGRPVFEGLTLELQQGMHLNVTGPNGAGKSTFLKLITGELPLLGGQMTRASGLIISQMPQQAQDLAGTPQNLARREGLDESYFLMLLRKLDFPREAFERDMSGYSMGQRKKVLLAAAMAKPAHVYIWDEPLNYLDLESREQVEEMLAQCPATLIFVEHDQRFVERVASHILDVRRGTVLEAPTASMG